MNDMVGFVSLGFLIICNIIAVAFFFGKLSASQVELEKRVKDLEDSKEVCPFHVGVVETISRIDANQRTILKKLDM